MNKKLMKTKKKLNLYYACNQEIIDSLQFFQQRVSELAPKFLDFKLSVEELNEIEDFRFTLELKLEELDDSLEHFWNAWLKIKELKAQKSLK